MERIAPLAKILAEANGIDWQQLRGTGDGGMVVEQDILNYLSRIMSGEEEPPSTPVDVPPPNWNGDVNAMPDLSGISADQMARAGVESDITALLGQAAPAPSPEVPATAPADLDDDLEFELDDAEPEPVAAAPILPPAPATPSLGGWEWSAASTPSPASVSAPAVPELELPNVDLPAVTDDRPAASAPAFQFGQPAEAIPAQPEPAPVIPAPAAEVATAVGLGSLLSRLYQSPAPASSEPAPVEATPQPALDTPAFQAPMDTDAGDVNSGPVLDTGTSWPAPSAVEAHAPEASAPEASEAEVPEATSPAVAAPEPAPVVAEEPAPVAEPEVQAAAPAPQEEPAAPAPAPAPEQPEAVTAPAAPAPDAVWFGTYLRRDTDFGALSALHGQLVAALGREVPLALLVARAAQRHAADLGVASVALQGAGGARSVAGDTLRAAADAVNYDYQGTPDLLVVDAGAHGLDDLHYPHTATLSVGRMQDGRAALSLNGTMDAAQGAAFLAAVAQTLGQPVLLLL
ncbi:hypothetical protein E7T09_10305 [Deinococcus sp. KSM4-11]|uniref:E3 binding domain-containing protein n=1 Tax=Deinococcus sp. KSM4-11 TaxID=2568654 RepID=UPI0010A4B899|nr:E3 binding domain-containing protein [Deinococcus sp. KSM4-11]THF86500.1 hypothetical protein E7T09_10305 [Deinococcus sp. KSM4-11]